MEEPRPLGTGGALKFAEDLLDERFLMLNGDVLTDIDLTRPARGARAHGRARDARAVPGRGPVARTGSCACSDDGAVREFVEKPAPDQIDTNNISAGAYVLERSVLELLEPGERGLDRARRVPAAGRRRALRPRRRRLLDGHRDARALPRGARSTSSRARSATEVAERLGDGFLCVEDGVDTAGGSCPPALVEAAAGSRAGARVGGRAVLERGVTVGEGTTIEGAVVMQGAEIGADCTLRDCIVGRRACGSATTA